MANDWSELFQLSFDTLTVLAQRRPLSFLSMAERIPEHSYAGLSHFEGTEVIRIAD